MRSRFLDHKIVSADQVRTSDERIPCAKVTRLTSLLFQGQYDTHGIVYGKRKKLFTEVLVKWQVKKSELNSKRTITT